LGGLLGAVGLDLARLLLGAVGPAFQLVFAVEAAAFVLAALLAVKATGAAAIRASAAQGKREQFA
jgi:BCD family chlorophyll transporter-like MFS transporter